MYKYIMLAIFVSLSGAAKAQEAPSFDCAAAQSSAEELICKDKELAALDRLVAKRFDEAVSVVDALDAGAQQAGEELRAMQRGWISGRDECWKADDLRACILSSYQRREGELVARYMLEEPKIVATWQCGAQRANELVTYFFETTTPSVRFERGDTVSTGSLSRTASGSRYDGDFGEFIWIKGDEARYRTADPDGVEAECVTVE